MNDQDQTWLLEQLMGTAELLGQQISPASAAMLADDLSTYPREVLARALSRVRTEHSGRLTPKAILDRIDEALGRPAANEAWAIAMQALDERATVVWTGEMSDAWLAAKPIADGGDMVGARMAFIAAYERLVRAAREARSMPVVHVSIGWDATARDAALEKAVQLGYLTDERANEHRVALPAPVFNPVALLTGNVEVAKHAPPDVRERLKKLRDDLAERRRIEDEARAQGVKAQQVSLAERKAEVQRLVDERLAKGAPE